MRRIHGLALVGALTTAACVGQIGDGGGGGGPGTGGVAGGASGGGTGSGSGAGGSTTVQSCGSSYAPGHVAIHRLTNDEYDHTVQDLLYTTATPATQFDPNPAGESGFTN